MYWPQFISHPRKMARKMLDVCHLGTKVLWGTFLEAAAFWQDACYWSVSRVCRISHKGMNYHDSFYLIISSVPLSSVRGEFYLERLPFGFFERRGTCSWAVWRIYFKHSEERQKTSNEQDTFMNELFIWISQPLTLRPSISHVERSTGACFINRRSCDLFGILQSSFKIWKTTGLF